MRYAADDYVDKLDKAILEFGRYDLQDKGLDAIMSTRGLQDDLDTAAGADAGQLLVEVLDYDGECIAAPSDRKAMVEYFVVASDHRDDADFDAFLDVDPRISGAY